MDYKEIVGLALEGKDYSEKTKDFTEEQKKELDIQISKAAKEEKTKELESLSAIRKEKNRVQGLADEANKNKPNPLETFAFEQEAAARSEFFADPDHLIPDDKKAEFDDVVKSLSRGEVSKEQKKTVLVRAYGAVMGSTLVDARKKLANMEKNAAEWNSNGANAQGSGAQPDASKYSQEALQLFRSWQSQGFTGPNYTIERAAKVNKDGLDRRL